MLLLPRLRSARPDHGLQDASAESVGRTAEEGKMKYCVGKMKCQFLGLKLEGGYECLNKSLVCEHQRIPIFEQDDKDQTLYDGDQPVLNRFADALEKIARELERGNKLKALSLRHKYEIDNDHIDEIMEE
jgi:hypothetical protein